MEYVQIYDNSYHKSTLLSKLINELYDMTVSACDSECGTKLEGKYVL